MSDLAPRSRDALLVLWCSFLTAAVPTMLVFAFVDPALLSVVDGGAGTIGHRTIYALGFMLFWCTGAVAASLVLWMAKTAERRRDGSAT